MSTGPAKLSLVDKGDSSANQTYASISPSQIASVEIFPPVGIGRFGDSEKEYFLSPEVPGRTNPPAGITTKFRDPEQRIRREAVRFRVYAYDAEHKLLGEVNEKVAIEPGSTKKYALKWTVHVANKKAAHSAFQGRYADPPVTALRNPNVQPDLDLDSRSRLIVDPKLQSISGGNTGCVNLEGEFQGSNKEVTDINTVYLGQLQVDNAGRLIFVPGTGHAKSVADTNNSQPEIVSEFDSSDWIDTACDGWVKVQVTADGFHKESEHAASVTTAPPKFAWGINAPTTLYNIMEDIYWRGGKPDWPSTPVTYDFRKDIWPVLNSASLISWTNNTALQGHGPSTNGHFSSEKVIEIFKGDNTEEKNALKTRIFEKLRKPDYEDPSQADARYMPRLSGDNGDMPDPGEFPSGLNPDIKRFATLTKLQYERFRKWKDHTDFKLPPSWSPEPVQERIEDFTEDQPEYLTRASLGATIGDPLFPGIEMYWFAKLSSTYDLNVSNLKPPFRVNHFPAAGPSVKPGDLTRGLSLPWQCDFLLCEVHWWPSVRPDNVVPSITYENTMGKSGTIKQFDTAATTRRNWTRGFRETLSLGQTRTTTDIPWYANTDMVRFWHHLGIVRKHEKQYQHGTITAYVESERLDL